MKNSLKSELQLARQYGFEAATTNNLVKNPYLRLADGSCLVWMAGKLLSRVTTKTYFGTGQYLKKWKSSDGNKPHASMTTTQIDADGKGRHTEIYYRNIYKEEINTLARRYNVSPENILGDHVNHIRGDNQDPNIELATSRQNNQNRSKIKITKAFYTLEDLETNLANGTWIKAID